MLQGRTNKKGITLIALIVTIVILLILSTVTVMEVRETALFGRAKDGAKRYKVAQIDERNKMDKWANDVDIWANMDNSSEGGSTKPDTKPEEKPKDPEQEKPKPRIEITNDLQIGDYVIYNVQYTDARMPKTNFTENNGWRVIDPGKKYSDKTYDGVKIIPTGNPVRMYYHYKKIENSGGTAESYVWKPTEQEIEAYKKEIPYYNKDSNAGVTAVAGLKNHIGKVRILASDPGGDLEKVTGGYETGKGWREEIKHKNEVISGEKDLATLMLLDNTGVAIECPTLEIVKETMMKRKNQGGREFIIDRLTDEDVKGYSNNTYKTKDDAAKGFWNLQDLGIGEYQVDAKEKYWSYWIASPHSDEGNHLRILDYFGTDGFFNNGYSGYRGLRPIVSLKSGIEVHKSDFQGN